MSILRAGSIAVVSALVIAGCAQTPTFQTGPDAEVTHDGLTKLDKTVMDSVWARTDIDLTSYSKVMFQGVGVEYRPVTGPYSGRAGMGGNIRTSNNQNEFPLAPETQQAFEEEIRSAFEEEIRKSTAYEVVDEAGPDVLLVVGGLLDVVSRVPPETVGRSRIWIESVGEATLVLEVRDSQSNAIFARAVDRRAAERNQQLMESNTVTNRAEVRRLGRRWGSTLREGLDALLTADPS